MVIIDRHFADTDSVVLLNPSLRERINVSFRGSLIKLLVQKPAGKIAQCDFDAEIQETACAVYTYQTGAEYNYVLLCLGNFLQNLNIVNVPEPDHIR